MFKKFFIKPFQPHSTKLDCLIEYIEYWRCNSVKSVVWELCERNMLVQVLSDARKLEMLRLTYLYKPNRHGVPLTGLLGQSSETDATPTAEARGLNYFSTLVCLSYLISHLQLQNTKAHLHAESKKKLPSGWYHRGHNNKFLPST